MAPMGSLAIVALNTNLPTMTVDWSLGFRRSETKAAATYWTELCGNRQMPSRTELKPRAIRSFLPYVSIVDLDSQTGNYTVALQATHSREVFGNLKGRKFAELFPPDVAQRWRDCFDLVCDRPQPVRLSSQVGTQNKLWLQCEALIAPLSARPQCAALASMFWVFVSWNRDAGTPVG